MRILATAVATALLASHAGAQEPEPRATMHELFEALAVLLPLSLDEQAFVDPAQREVVQARIRALADSSDALRAHARDRDPGFAYLSRSLASDVEEIRTRYEAGRTEEARYYLQELTQNCIACHSRLPSARDFPLAGRLTEAVEVAALPAHQKAQLLVATRRFDAALATWEALLADPAVDPTELDIRGDLVDYLTVSIRVQNDLERPHAALSRFAKRKDVPRYLRRYIDGWVGALLALPEEAKAPPTLALARSLVERANTAIAFPGGREKTVYDLLASSVLHRYVDAAEPGDPGLPEAFYLLGVIEGRTADSYWVPQTEFHLEAAIRADPKGPFAAPAYALLEEYVIVGHGGASNNLLPRDARQKLDELADLIEP